MRMTAPSGTWRAFSPQATRASMMREAKHIKSAPCSCTAPSAITPQVELPKSGMSAVPPRHDPAMSGQSSFRSRRMRSYTSRLAS